MAHSVACEAAPAAAKHTAANTSSAIQRRIGVTGSCYQTTARAAAINHSAYPMMNNRFGTPRNLTGPFGSGAFFGPTITMTAIIAMRLNRTNPASGSSSPPHGPRAGATEISSVASNWHGTPIKKATP